MKTVLSIIGLFAIVVAVLIFARMESSTSHAQESILVDSPSESFGNAVGTDQTAPIANKSNARHAQSAQWATGTKISTNSGFAQPVRPKSVRPQTLPAVGSSFQAGLGQHPESNFLNHSFNGGSTSIGTHAAPTITTSRAPQRFAVSTSYPKNAHDIKNLVRAQYSLPAEAAKTLVEFFSQDVDQKIETKTEASESSPFVTVQVTTDDSTQRAVANFLNAVYPEEKLRAIRTEFESAKIAEGDETTDETTDDTIDLPTDGDDE